MASITIRDLDDDVTARLRVRAADNGRSVEEEARLILRDVVGHKPGSRNLTSIIRSHFGPANGVDLELPPREPGREPPSFDSIAAIARSHRMAVATRNVRDFEGAEIEVVDPWARA